MNSPLRPAPILTLAALGLVLGLSGCSTPPSVVAAPEAPLPPGIDVSGAENVRPALPAIPDRTFTLADFGGVGDGQTDNTAAFKKAIAAVQQAGGGKLVVPAGIYPTLPFTLCSNLDFHLDAGAVIKAPATFTAAGLPEPETLHSQAEVRSKVKTPQPLITAENVHDLALTGPGTIDGNGAHWWAWSERAARASPGRIEYTRPNLIYITGCHRLHVADLTLTNSSRYHLLIRDVIDLTVERVKVRAPFNAPNTDAIDIGPGTNFLVRDCDIDTGDDDICVKGGGNDVLIEDCTIHHGHGISIGSGTVNGVDDMLVRHCTFDGADYGIRIKSERGLGGLVRNVRYTDVQMKNVGYAITIYSDYSDSNRPNFKGDPTLVPRYHDILIDHVTVDSARNAGRIVGLPESRITGVTLRDVKISAETDFVVKDADQPLFQQVSIKIKQPDTKATGG
jgi:polygalacturonase